MSVFDYIKQSLEASKGWASGLIQDMADAPLTQPTPNGGNHPLWVLGHLVVAESILFDQFVGGRPNRFPELESLFSIGSTPTTDGSQYPSMDELFAKWEQIRADVVAHLDSLSEEDLKGSTHAPEDFGEMFGTVGGCYIAMTTHVSFHSGQVSDARRAAGRDPLMA